MRFETAGNRPDFFASQVEQSARNLVSCCRHVIYAGQTGVVFRIRSLRVNAWAEVGVGFVQRSARAPDASGDVALQAGDNSSGDTDSVKTNSKTGAKVQTKDRDMGAALRTVYQKTVDESIPAEMLDLLGKLD